ncbi:MAG: SurA N-terminal domain-containing protein [Nitrospirota bacterium]|nr:SurA N-terminal domain-containing protein [Nitrospirota bacterium]
MLKHTIVAGAALLLVAAGCTKSDDAKVVAKVNNAKITVSDFKRQMDSLENPQMQISVVTDPKLRKEFLDDLIGIELVIQEAKRLGLDKDPEFKKRQEALRKDMEVQVQNAVRNDLFRSLLKKELADKLAKVEQPTAKEIQEFYTKNQNRMVSMNGKRMPLKEVEPRIRDVLFQNKQRDVYLDYTKALKAKASVSVDEKALEAAVEPVTKPTGTLDLQVIPAPDKKGQAATK